ncbi:hypothetical protein F0L74_30080 [Chitinophaga agrisoli]|uniref:Uncharacterized protein n=1 Tax=Chitinophaga agrisoli TaxID=2607653 RepID=A0A5B2VN15_9BACT|nr:hypothetical protein [Chitinophaga agrisoli]KAA2240405.1 hypothetical protein F0L74_30080 [Chitinophaga agrisoli]
MNDANLTELLYTIPPHIIVIIICLIISLASLLKKDPPRYLPLFTCYILVTLIVECSGWWWSRHGKSNFELYNFYLVLHITYAIYLLRSFLLEGKARRIFSWILLLYPITAMLNIYFIQGPHHFGTYSYIVGAVIVVICSIFYFYQRIKFPGRQNLLREPSFWIATGLLFFNTITVPYLGLLNFIGNLPQYAFKTFANINTITSIILYLLYCISSLCSLNFRKLPS